MGYDVDVFGYGRLGTLLMCMLDYVPCLPLISGPPRFYGTRKYIYMVESADMPCCCFSR